MKRTTIKLTSWLLLILIIASTVCLFSCENSAYNDYTNDLDSADITNDMNSNTVIDSTETGESSSVVKNITQNITNNTITITGDNTNSVAYGAANGLRSAVSIYCTFETTSSGNSYWNPRPSTQTYYTTGSGVIYQIDDNGNAFIVTNHHVVYDSSSNTDNGISDKIYIYLYGLENDAYAIPAVYVGGSANYDLAVLHVNANEVLKEAYESGVASSVTIANSDLLTPGQTTIVIGNPSTDGLSGIAVTAGIVSVDSEYITMTSNTGTGEVSFRVIRTDAPVNSGNSGGGMYNDRGELIGIVNAKISSSDIENIGYALPSNVVRAIADNIIYYCYGNDCESVVRCLLGITIEVSDYDTYLDLETGLIVRKEEISVREVTLDGAAKEILKAGDIIKSISIGETTISITRQHHLIDAMLDVRIGDTVSLVIFRDGIEITVSTIITEDFISEY